MSVDPLTVSLVEDVPEDVPDSASGQFNYVALDMNQDVPKDYFIFSLVCLIYSHPCPCVGLAALMNSVKARDRKMVGDYEGARSFGLVAWKLNMISTVFFCFCVFITLILMFTIGIDID